MMSDNTAQVKFVMAQVFNVPVSAILDNASMDNTENWDSLRHMHLIMALEEKFGVSLDEEAALNMSDIAMVKQALAAQGINF